MQKQIKKLIEAKLYGQKENESDWKTLIEQYFAFVKDDPKGIVLEWRYFRKKNYWRCIRELEKIKTYYEKDNFYRIVNDLINDIALRASYLNLINPFELEV